MPVHITAAHRNVPPVLKPEDERAHPLGAKRKVGRLNFGSSPSPCRQQLWENQLAQAGETSKLQNSLENPQKMAPPERC